jgi:hypothetical protein
MVPQIDEQWRAAVTKVQNTDSDLGRRSSLETINSVGIICSLVAGLNSLLIGAVLADCL